MENGTNHPNATVLARTVGQFLRMCALSSIILWFMPAHQLNAQPDVDLLRPNLQVQTSHRVVAIAAMPGGKRIVSGGTDGSVKIWDVGTGRLLRTLNNGGFVTSLVVARNGRTICSAGSGEGVKCWDAGSGRLIRTYLDSPVDSIALSPREDLIASASHDDVSVWDVDQAKVISWKFPAQGKRVNIPTIAFTQMPGASLRQTGVPWSYGI
jgi:WD40 repeat protein